MTTGGYNPSTTSGGGGGGTGELAGVYYDPSTKTLIDAQGNMILIGDLEEGPVVDMWGNIIAT